MVNIIVKPETPYLFERKYFEVNEIGVLTSKQGNGYGKQIMLELKNMAKASNIHRIELNMWTFNENALNFYKKIGFNTYRRYLEMFI